MTITAGRHSAPSARRSVPVAPLLAYGVGVLASAVAWLLLVRASIHFGVTARDGEAVGWAFFAVTVVGAICCLLLALLLVGRVLMSTGVISDYQPRRAQRRG